MKKPPSMDKVEVRERSLVAALKDLRAQRDDPTIQVQREVVQQLDAIEPDVGRLRDSLTELLQTKGSDGCFLRDEHTQLSVVDALEANKERPAARAAVDVATRVLQQKIGRENDHAARQRQRREERENTPVIKP